MSVVAYKLASGEWAAYLYAGRGGPLIRKAYAKSREEAVKAVRTERLAGLSALIAAYQDSIEFKALSPDSRRKYSIYLKRIDDRFGSYSLESFADFRIKEDLMAWRDTFASTPRAADYTMRVGAAMFSWASKRGKVGANPFLRPGRLHRVNRSHIIWTPKDLAAVCEAATPALSRAIRLAATTGLRRGDLIALQWSSVYAQHIQVVTSKRDREAIIPLTDAAKAVLAEMPRTTGTVLLSQRGLPWTGCGIATEFHKAKAKAGIGDLHFHDLRGNAATAFRTYGLTNDEIALCMGWSRETVETLMRKYVSRADVMRAAIARVRKVDAKGAKEGAENKSTKSKSKRHVTPQD